MGWERALSRRRRASLVRLGNARGIWRGGSAIQSRRARRRREEGRRCDAMRQDETRRACRGMGLPQIAGVSRHLFFCLGVLLFGGYQADSSLELKKGSYGRVPLRGGLSLLVTRNDRGFPGSGRERTRTIRRRSGINARAAIITLTTTAAKRREKNEAHGTAWVMSDVRWTTHGARRARY